MLPIPLKAAVSLCDQLEYLGSGDYLYGQTETHISTATRRPPEEPAAIGRSAVKGAMARRIVGEFSGMPVRWSEAVIIGPVSCPGFNAYQILVDPLRVRLVARGAGQSDRKFEAVPPQSTGDVVAPSSTQAPVRSSPSSRRSVTDTVEQLPRDASTKQK